jgi:hypothetical protein
MGADRGRYGYSTCRAHLLPGLFKTQAYEMKKAARFADDDYTRGGDGRFEVVALGESPFDINRPSICEWLKGHPHAFTLENWPF